MEKRLEKNCRAVDFELGGRYSMISTLDLRYGFTVTSIDAVNNIVKLTYMDGVFGAIAHDASSWFYEIPLTPLELELL
jgi:hypothetical protein